MKFEKEDLEQFISNGDRPTFEHILGLRPEDGVTNGYRTPLTVNYVKIPETLIDSKRSKCQMPKVFDDFAKQFDLKTSKGACGLDAALMTLLQMYLYGDSDYEDLENYMNRDDVIDQEFYGKAVQALIFGYDVRPDPTFYVTLQQLGLFFKHAEPGISAVSVDWNTLSEPERSKFTFTLEEITKYKLNDFKRIQA